MKSVWTTVISARDRCLPVDEVFASMLPDAGLLRGRTIGCVGPAGMSLALALAARAVTAGSWLAVVGVPMLGIDAAIELGVSPSRLVIVDADGGPSVWADRVAAAADGFELILTCPPAGSERIAGKVRTRLQARGVVMLVVGAGAGVGSGVGSGVGATSPSVACDLEFTTTAVSWVGLGQGHGYLFGRRATVRAGGRRQPRPIERQLWLPGPHGRVELVESVEQERVVAPVIELSRAG